MRKNLGLGMGRGYYNLVPIDSHIHSLSAKGVKLFPSVHYGKVNEGVRIYHSICPSCGKSTGKHITPDVYCESCTLSDLSAKNIYRQHTSYGFDSSEIEKEVERLKKESVMRRKLILEGKLNGKHFKSRIMWNPRTNKIISGDNTHDAILEQHLRKVNPSYDYLNKNLNKFNEWVRGLYDEENKTLYVRQYFNPKSLYSEFTAKDFEISEKLQKKFVEQLHLPKDVKVVYNATNENLRQEGYIHS